MNARVLFLATMALLLATVSGLADELKLPGHELNGKGAAAKADTVFLGKLVRLDQGNARGEYVGSVVYLSRQANGITPSRATQNTSVRTPAIPSDLGIPVTMKVGAGEQAPRVGDSYIFYAKDNKHPGATGYEALKLSPTADHGLPSRIF